MPMTLIIYYIGAGASYGIRKYDEIIEGIPVVKEIPGEFDALKRFIEKADVPEGDIVFQDMYRTGHDDVEKEKRYMLHDINSLIQGIKDHATIDTYARKLYLTKRYRDLERLKSLLCAFFLWEQLEHRPDGRYDTFLANVLDNHTLNIPEEISIIAWNYDSQIELAFSSYNQNAGLAVFEKNIVGKWPTLAKTGRVFKVNGSATYANGEIVSLIKNYDKTSVAIQIIQFYSNSMADTTDMGFQFKTHLSFAWEDSPNALKMRETIKATVADTEQMVVVGYSFPFFNRETDREIIGYMDKLKKIYVQDMNADEVEQSLLAVLPEDKKIEIKKEYKCSQFCLPKEL
jgi:hypothetical protein